MKNTLTALFLLVGFIAFAQDCKCEDEFNYVVNYYEENLPGFTDNVNEHSLGSYTELKSDLVESAKIYCEDRDMCLKTILVYVEFFKDNHSSIYFGDILNVDKNNKKEVSKFIDSDIFKNRETIEYIKSESGNAIQSIENLYQTKSGVYKVAVVESKNRFRDYAGVVTHSSTPLWKKGQVKFELKRTGENVFDMFYYLANHHLLYSKNVKLVDGVIDNYWYNTTLKHKPANNMVSTDSLVFKEIDEKTNYMYIPTFGGSQIGETLDFYKKHDSLIQSKPYLIIDVRDNGGGNTLAAKPLIKYMFTKPFQTDTMEIYATKENIRKYSEFYDEIVTDTVNYSKEYLERLLDLIKRLKQAPDQSLVLDSEPKLITRDSVLNYPKKIAVIANRYSASTTEELLLWAMESDKTIIVGENSGGYIGYGDVHTVDTPNFSYMLTCTKTRYSKQRKYEVDGIPPNIYLDLKEDWIKQTLMYLKK